MVRMSGGGGVQFQDNHNIYAPDEDGIITIPEALVPTALALGFGYVDEQTPAAPAEEEKRGLEVATDLTKGGTLEEGALGEGTDAELAAEKEAAEVEALSAEGQAAYSEARGAGLSHGEALELVGAAAPEIPVVPPIVEETPHEPPAE